jgi:hypothetical protein
MIIILIGYCIHNSGVSETYLTRKGRPEQNLKVVWFNIGIKKAGATSDNFSTSDRHVSNKMLNATDARKNKIQFNSLDWSGRLDNGSLLSIHQLISLVDSCPQMYFRV